MRRWWINTQLNQKQFLFDKSEKYFLCLLCCINDAREVNRKDIK